MEQLLRIDANDRCLSPTDLSQAIFIIQKSHCSFKCRWSVSVWNLSQRFLWHRPHRVSLRVG